MKTLRIKNSIAVFALAFVMTASLGTEIAFAGLGCRNGDCVDGAVGEGVVSDEIVDDGSGAVGAGADATRCGMPAPQYPVPFATPRPTVPTHFTYPPMMPHHSLPHYRNVYSYKHAEGLSRTNVHWHSQPVVSGLRRLHHIMYLPR